MCSVVSHWYRPVQGLPHQDFHLTCAATPEEDKQFRKWMDRYYIPTFGMDEKAKQKKIIIINQGNAAPCIL